MKIAILSVLAVSATAFTNTAPITTTSTSTRSTGTVVPSTIRLPSFGLYASVADKATTSAKSSKTSSSTSQKKSDITPDQVRALFGLWNDALATGDSRIVASRYAPGATLLPTVSDIPRTDFDSIKNYFDSFLLKKPQGTILEGYIRIGDGWAQDNGIYEFTMGATGDVVKARYSFMYVQDPVDGKWKIGHHHSSQMPEGITVAQKIDKNQVRNLFKLWNDALATLDPSAVAARYTKDAVLLPTVSDIPRDTPAKITDYFTKFCQLEPQGTILQSFVQIGTNWCKDSGIYEFKMGATGATVKARYTFIYKYEDGQWKIAHHHSSQMPEEVEPKTKAGANVLSQQQVRDLFLLWNGALATLDPKQVAARYAKKSILLPTVSDEPRSTAAGITDYFVNFLKKKPQGQILEGMVRAGDGWAQDAGVYEFTMGNDGSKVLARYSFVYVFEDGEWKIAHHHSSVMPEGFLNAPKGEVLSDEAVRDLFQLWNNALATGDPAQVAARYSKNAILLPTVSDTPRKTKESITDYFVSFLKNKPQGVITQGVTMAGEDWCEDAGVYEFTMGATGDKVLARYSFVYVKEDGEWKIAHHHSSAMPEGMMAAANKIKALEAILSK
ncbi:calcium/calmodulin dependent protein kinase II association-domain containing protein [Nitzschia inconspicua]|uniref:Calcium/calmodulin dependent protein kinase II association-domain containing protein n=1 Tax=Nitzschia inconspicua TaxID=303405 RepID=A0A9K3KL10_9STRA|nr:calcium/calmodulin dependent protein kinase II association-domain containing protein [Nitzschia inconspicua]